MTRAKVAEKCGIGESYLKKLIDEKNSNHHPGPVLALRLYRVLKPPASEVAEYLAQSGLEPLLSELSLCQHETGLHNMITACTGVASSKTLQWMVQQRMGLDEKYFADTIIGLKRKINGERLNATLEKWSKALDEFDFIGIADANEDFHRVLVNAAQGAAEERIRREYDGQGQLMETRLQELREDYLLHQSLVREMHQGMLGSFSQAITVGGASIPQVVARNAWTIDEERRLYTLHKELGGAMERGDDELARILMDWHRNWAFISRDQLETMLQRDLGRKNDRVLPAD
jgi:hypothetical protein